MKLVSLIVVAFIPLAACSSTGPAMLDPDGGVDGQARDAASDADAALPACHWPASFDKIGAGRCVAARAFVNCMKPSGGGCTCLSDGPTECADCPASTGAMCTPQCGPDEYVLSCGADASIAADEVPSTCTGIGFVPSDGSQDYCCPCQ